MLPKEVDIYGQKYQVIETCLKAGGDNGDALCGRVLYPEKIIKIEKTMNYENKILTLMHEMGHAFGIRVGFYLMDSWSHDIEELIVEGFNTCTAENFDIYPKGHVLKLEKRLESYKKKIKKLKS
jgi:dihydroorotase